MALEVQTHALRALAAIVAVATMWSFASAAEPDEAYCWPEERFAPDGRIVELGGRFFHLCGAPGDGFPYNNDPQADYRHVSIGSKGSTASEVELETDAPSFLWGKMEFRKSRPGTHANLMSQLPNRIGDIRLGGTDYEVYVSDRGLEYYPGPAEKGKLPDDALYIFQRPAGSDIPSHMMTCRGDPTAFPRERYHCNVYLRYLESNGFMIDHRLMWSPIFEGEPMDFDRLPDLVRAVHALFDHADVTDRLDTLEGVPIVRVPE